MNSLKGPLNLYLWIWWLQLDLLYDKTVISYKGVLNHVQIMGNLFFIVFEQLYIKHLTSKVYFWLAFTISMITSMLNLAGLIVAEWIFASFIIILKGFVLNYIIITDEFCATLRHRRSNMLDFKDSFVPCIPCWELTHSESLICCIRYNEVFNQCSFELDIIIISSWSW